MTVVCTKINLGWKGLKSPVMAYFPIYHKWTLRLALCERPQPRCASLFIHFVSCVRDNRNGGVQLSVSSALPHFPLHFLFLEFSGREIPDANNRTENNSM